MAGTQKEISYRMIMFDECIPDELLFEIFVRLPAQDIYFGARLVCRKWYNIIRTKYFIHDHLEHARYGLLYRDGSGNLVFTAAREDGRGTVDTYKFNYKISTPVWSSWNGLMLEYDAPSKGYIYRHITNALTGQILRLPSYPYYLYVCGLSGIGYDAASTAYKVIVPYMHRSTEYGCAILTEGVDKLWRIVPIDHLSLRGKCTITTCPIITTEGFVHWKRFGSTEVVTLNLDTETFVEILPPEVEEENTKSWCLSSGRYLSLFVGHGRLAWEIFEMKPEIGEWRKFTNICFEGQRERIESLGFEHADIVPFGWLKYPEVLALKVNCVAIIFYNLITREIEAETLSTSYDTCVTLHKNSLVWLVGP